MKESELQKVYNYLRYPRFSKFLADKAFVLIDNGSMGGTHRVCVSIKYNKSIYCDGFGDTPDTFLLQQLSKPVIDLKCRIQDTKFNLCGSCCLYFFYLLQILDCNDV